MKKIYEIQKENFDKPYKIDCEYMDNYYIFTIDKEYIISNEVNNRDIVGYIIYKNSVDIVELIEIAIKKDSQNLGYANKLLSETVKNFTLDIHLEVEYNNVNAIKLYEKNKFKKISLRKNYYGISKDAIIMSRSSND